METNRNGWSDLNGNKRPSVHNVQRLQTVEVRSAQASSSVASGGCGYTEAVWPQSLSAADRVPFLEFARAHKGGTIINR